MAEIAKLDDEKKREKIWSLYYQNKWYELPNQQQQSASKKSWEKKNVIEELIPTGGTQAAKNVIIKGWNSFGAKEVVKASSGGVSTVARTRGAAIIAEESAKQAAARGAYVAMTGVKAIASLPVGITAAVGEIAGDMIAAKAGIQNHHAKNAFGASGAMVGGASAGVFVGGPIGAAVGAAVGASSWAVGQGIKALMHIGKGPNDNGCDIKIDDIGNDELCVGTYAGNDTLYWKTYSKQYKKSNNEWVMSAGQSQTGVFQLCIWHNGRVIKHFNEVYYRDMFVIIKKGRTFRVVHCRGQHHPIDSGKVYVSEN